MDDQKVITERIKRAAETGATSIDLSRSRLKSLPPEIGQLIPEHDARKIDKNDLNGEKTRLHQLRHNLGEILERLYESLTLDIREAAFESSLARILQKIAKLPAGEERAAPAVPASANRALSNLLFARNRFSTGRKEALADLHRVFA